MYSKQEKERALQLYDKTGSASAVVKRLEYPTRKELYRWIYERKIKNRKEILRRYKNTEDHPIHPDIDLKIKVLHRCFESGESIESVSEETGYSRQSIYAWRRKYLQKGLLTLVPQKDISRMKIMANYKTTFQSNENPDVEKLKKQMKDLQIEVDILKETIKIIKKDPGINLTKIKCQRQLKVSAFGRFDFSGFYRKKYYSKPTTPTFRRPFIR
jgi:transposase-like protein